MAETDFTTNRRLPFPTGKDLIQEGPAEMQAIANAVDTENRGEIDYLQAGVVRSTDWSFTAGMESSSECKLDSTGTTGGVAWLPLAAIGLVRSVTTAAKLKALKPSSLPGSGKYMTVGFELTPSTSGASATVSIVPGTEQASQKAAEEHSPTITAGNARVRDVVILNTAGTYSILSQTDRRAWATGGEVAAETSAQGKIAAGAVTTAKIAPEAVTETELLKAIVEKLTHRYFTTPKGGGGLIIEETVIVPANTLVTWQAWVIATSGATTEVGCVVKLLKNGSVVAEGGGQLQEEKIPSRGAGQVVAQYVQATAGTFTWKVELFFFGTAVFGETKPGLLAFT
jgi:hypothetical protein